MMTSISAQTPEPPPPDEPRDRSVPLLVAAGVVVVAVVALVLLVGIQRPPPLDPIDAAPAVNPPGSVAWIDHGTDEGCLRTADPTGVVRDVTCELSGEVLGWDERGIVVRAWSQSSEGLIAVDPETGESRFLERQTEPGMAPFTSPLTQRDEGTLRVSVLTEDAPNATDGATEDAPTLWEVEAPDTYDVVTAAVSPDGSSVALGDNAGRLLVVPADGSAPPRVWTDEAPRYVTVVWEGTVLPGSPG